MRPIVLALSLLVLAAVAPPALTTTAETTKYLRTGRYAEVEALCAAYPKAFAGKVKCEKFGTTPQGRPMLMLVASGDGTFSADECAKKQRPVVLIQAGIHAGEIDGKDAGFEVLRGLLDGSLLPGALSKLTLIFVPVFNIDGHERFGPNNRPNQIGPAEKGWRVTANNYNLNRDYMKADAPEMQAMLTLLHRYDPVMYVDLHVTDGAKFQHDVAVFFEPYQTGPEALRSYGKAMHVALTAELKEKGHLPVEFYPQFLIDDDPKSGFAYGWSPLRFATAYWTANNRYGVLVEAHSWKNYATRVKVTFDACAGLLRLASEDGARWLKAANEADAADLKRAGTDVVLSYEPTKHPKELDFLGYAYTIENSQVSNKPWVRYDDSKPETWKVPYYDEVTPALKLTSPKGGYLVPAEDAALVAQKLKLHGFRFVTLKTPRKAAKVESVRLEATLSPKSQEGHQTVTTKGTWRADVRDLGVGSLFVPTAQAHLTVLMHLLEPASADSLLSWGFFNAHLEQKEYLEDYVAEEYARELLTDATIKTEFELRLKDPAFAKDSEARLAFFTSRHPSFDATFNLYPVFRTAESDFH